MGNSISSSYSACLTHCREEDQNCNWTTFDPDSGICYDFYDCPEILTDQCPQCVTGQKECDEDKVGKCNSVLSAKRL